MTVVLTRVRSRSGLRLLRRVGWGVGDQAASSLTNFAAAAAAAHLLSTRELGAYSLGFLAYGLALNCSRGLVTDPLMVRFSTCDDATRGPAVRACTGAALAVGAVVGLVVLLVALVVPAPVRGALLALGAVMPLLLLQDAWRYVFFVAGRGDRSLVNDLAWAGSIVPALVLVAVTDHRTAAWFILGWGGASGAGALLGMWQAGVLPDPTRARHWLVRNSDLGVRFMAEGVAGNLATQLRAWGLGIAVGLAAVGQLQVVTTLMGPLMILLVGTSAVAVPELAHVLRRSTRWLLRACLGMSAVLVAAAVAWGVLVWLTLPHGVGNVLVGSKWEQVHTLTPLAATAMACGAVMSGATGGLRALGAARRSLRAMLVAGAAYAVGSVVGAFTWGLPGALLGTAVASLLGASMWWWQLHRALREYDPATTAPAGAVTAPLAEPAGP